MKLYVKRISQFKYIDASEYLNSLAQLVLSFDAIQSSIINITGITICFLSSSVLLHSERKCSVVDFHHQAGQYGMNDCFAVEFT